MDINDKHRDWLILTQAKAIGPVICLKLLAEYETPDKVLELDSARLSTFGLSKESISSLLSPDLKKLERSIQWLSQPGNELVTILDDDYPALLKTIHDPPPVLFMSGRREALRQVHFAIVGSRNPTADGRKHAENFAAGLSRQGLSICSGLALGIDYHSHLGALNVNGTTVAVLGNGLDSIYPARHKKIAEQIRNTGLLISEFPPGTRPAPGNFPRRNRIISGLSTGVLVVEAARKSGSLITARQALEQGREVFAIPGSIHNPLTRGTHSLIKNGAKLVESLDDIFEELAPCVNLVLESISDDSDSAKSEKKLESEYEVLLNQIGFDEFSVDELVKSSGLTADSVSSMLLILELQGVIESRHGGKYCRSA